MKKNENIFVLNNDLINKKYDSFKIQIIKSLIYILIIISIIQQFSFLSSYYSNIRNVLYFIAFLALIISLTELPKIKTANFIKIFFYFFLSFQLLALIGILYGNSLGEVGTLYLPISVSFFIYMISFILYNRSNLKTYYNISIIYIISVLPLNFDIFKTYFNNRIFISAQYLVSKKGDGVMMGFAILLSIYLILKTKSKMAKILFLLFIIFTFVIVNLVRERSILLGLYISIIILILKSIKINKIFFLILLTLLTLMLLFLMLYPNALYFIVSSIIQPFTKGFDVNSLNNLSAGRIQLFFNALKVFGSHPITGTLGSKNYYVDNTLLISLANYGVVGAALCVIFIGFLIYIGIAGLIKYSISEIRFYISLILINSLILSFFQGLSPFGPGTIYIILWILLPLITSKDHKKGDQILK